MEKLLNMKLLSFLSDTSSLAINEIQNGYECFMKYIRAISQSENNYSETYRELNLTRIELVSLQAYLQCEQGEKCTKISVLP